MARLVGFWDRRAGRHWLSRLRSSVPRAEAGPSAERGSQFHEWIDACKGGQPGGSNFDWAGPLTEVVLLGNVALHLQMKEELTRKRLLWDGPNLRFTNSDEANKFLRTEYRQGWSL